MGPSGASTGPGRRAGRGISRSGARALRAFWARAYVRVVAANRDLSWILFDVALPVLGTAAYVFVYRSLRAPEAYLGFVTIGGAMTAYWLNVLWSMASQLFWEKQSGNLEAYIVAPAPMMAILAGMATGGLFMTTIRAVVIVAVAVAWFRIPLVAVDPAGVAAAFVVSMVGLYGLGMSLSSAFLLHGREAWHLSNLMQEPVYLLSGFFFPVRALGFWVSVAASIVPLTLGMDAMRQGLYGPEAAMALLPLRVELAILAVLAIVFLLAAWWLLRVMERLARREGRLTLRWQ
ncbi:MAG: ABC transporter permease [Limnochordaceae bacterium]|nr:ABC transporter permease [Limnochordaceae bacterium]